MGLCDRRKRKEDRKKVTGSFTPLNGTVETGEWGSREIRFYHPRPTSHAPPHAVRLFPPDFPPLFSMPSKG